MKPLLYTLGTALLMTTPLSAEEVIGVTERQTKIPLQDGHAPLHIQQWHEDGDLNITGHDQPSIIVVIEKFNPDDEDRDSATIRYDEKSGRLRVSLRGDLDESDLTYFVPRNTSVELKNSDGDVSVNNINGTIEISANDGDILLQDVSGTIEVRTDDGDIEADGISGSFVAHSDDGDVDAVVSNTQPLELASIASEDGDIDLVLPANFNGSLAASTADGDFSSDFPIDMGATGGAHASKKGLFKVAGHIGSDRSGSSRLAIATSDGDISIRKQTSP